MCVCVCVCVVCVCVVCVVCVCVCARGMVGLLIRPETAQSAVGSSTATIRAHGSALVPTCKANTYVKQKPNLNMVATHMLKVLAKRVSRN